MTLETKVNAGSGILFEPRSLWDVQTFTPTVSGSTFLEQTLSFNRQQFFNGGKWPITLTRVSFCPISYALRTQTGVTAIAASPWTFENSMAIIARANLRISAPFRRHFSRTFTAAEGLIPLKTWVPKLAQGFQLSSIYGLSRLEFDRPIVLPRLGSCLFQVSAVPYPDIHDNIWDDAPTKVQMAIAWHEYGGSMNGAARMRPRAVLDGVTAQNLTLFGIKVPQIFVNSNSNIPATTTNTWPGSGMFTSAAFDRENASRSGATTLTGINVHIDQIDYDNVVRNQNANDGVGTTALISPISTMVACRAKTAVGGTGEWWWREGAPLCLVLDTITPALVYGFPNPITLEPGDTLDVELDYPVTQVPESGLVHGYTFGVSLNGFAIIEG